MPAVVFVVILYYKCEGILASFLFSFLRSLSLYTVEALWMRMRFLRGLLGRVTDGHFFIHTTHLLIIFWYARG